MSKEHKHSVKITQLVEEQLGRDIDSELISDLAIHMEECPECKIYVDSVKQTIKLYRVTKEEQSIPDDVSNRLFKVLNLNKYK